MAQIDNYEWINMVPSGWHELARKMIEECEEINSTYSIEDLKEKWGEIRVCSFIQDGEWPTCASYDTRIEEIENKYIALSKHTCCNCGRPATKWSTGWILPWCDKCGKDEEKYYKRFMQ